MSTRLTTLLLFTLSLFFVAAGVNHFLEPHFYLPLIPPYIPYPGLVNDVSGALEITFGILVALKQTRKWGALGILALLVAFIPSHIHFIQIGACAPDSLCTPMWVAWLRLLVGQPLLIAWAAFFYFGDPDKDSA